MVLLRPLDVETFAGPNDEVTPRSVLASNATHMRTNWRDPVQVTTRWETDRTYSPVGGVTQKSALRLRPERRVSSTHSLYGADYEFGLQHIARLTPRQSTPTQATLSSFGTQSVAQHPLGSDCSKVLSSMIDGSSLKVFCDTRWRRFFVGARVYFIPPVPTVFTVSTIRTNVMLGVIEDIDDDWLLVTIPPTHPTIGWTVEPCLDVAPSLATSVSGVTAKFAEAELDLVEIGGASALPALPTPTTFQTHTGRDLVERMVLDLTHNWGAGLEWGVGRDGSDRGLASSSEPWQAGVRARAYASVQARFFSRETAWPYLAAFDAMQGRRGTFWAIYPRIVLSTLTWTTGAASVVVPAQGDMIEWRFSVDAIAFRLDNGNWSIHEFLAIVDNLDGTWTVGVSPVMPTADTATCIRFAARSSFDTDEITEVWTTNEIVDVSFPISELSSPADHQLDEP